jgi:hypothetical protein
VVSDQEFDWVAQNGHDTAGIMAVLGPVAILGPAFHWAALGAACLYGFATWKEFWWDARHETPDVRGSDLEDWCHYVIPCTITLCIYWAKLRWLGTSC